MNRSCSGIRAVPDELPRANIHFLYTLLQPFVDLFNEIVHYPNAPSDPLIVILVLRERTNVSVPRPKIHLFLLIKVRIRRILLEQRIPTDRIRKIDDLVRQCLLRRGLIAFL